MPMNSKRAAVGVLVVAGLTLTSACGANGSGSASGSKKSQALKVGWSTIYLTPSWMQQTQKLMAARADELKKSGDISSYNVDNANGDTSQQIAQIQGMIQQKYNVIIVDAGSSTALNPVLNQAVSKGITVVNFDSLVSTDKVVRVGTDQTKWGEIMANFIVAQLHGKGNIIAFNGPAGVAVSEQRWQGAQKVFKANPGIKIVSTLNSEYNIAPAAQTFAAAYAANKNIDAVCALGGALSDAALQTILKQNGKLIPITGENYNGFLKMWQANVSKGFKSVATAQPNYLGTIAIDAGVQKAHGDKVPNNINVPLPKITNKNLAQWVKPSQSDDYYPIQVPPQAALQKLITP